jgi:hypothetical protein
MPRLEQSARNCAYNTLRNHVLSFWSYSTYWMTYFASWGGGPLFLTGHIKIGAWIFSLRHFTHLFLFLFEPWGLEGEVRNHTFFGINIFLYSWIVASKV